jgi:hypothetical protein
MTEHVSIAEDIELDFGAEDWDRLERNWSAWWAGELERPLVLIESWEPPGEYLPPLPHFTNGFPPDMPVDKVLDRYQPHLQCRRFYGDAWPKWYPNFGPGIVAGFLGAQVHITPDTVWFGLRESADVSELSLSFLPDNELWFRVRELTRAAVERWSGRVSVGFTDLGGNLDILAALRGTQNLLLDMHDAPDEVARLVAQITRLWLCYYDELNAIIQAGGRGSSCWGGIWSPGRCYMLQSDFAYMISPRMFEHFVLPDLAACCNTLDHGFYHLDGQGQIRHLDMLLSLNRLRGIQWIPGAGAPPPEEWLPLLKRIRDAGKLCQLYVTSKGALTIVRELGGRGFAFCIVDGLDERGFYRPQRMPSGDAKAFLKEIGAPPEGGKR